MVTSAAVSGPDQPKWCHNKVCRWAVCDKGARLGCPRTVWARQVFDNLRQEGRLNETDPAVKVKDSRVRTSKDDEREFHQDARKRDTYVAFGDEEHQCGRWGLIKECTSESCGAVFGKKLCCGREWCPFCGEDDSEHHKRRMSRLIDRVFAMLAVREAVGYFVFEFPLELRVFAEDVEELREAGNYIRRMLRREGFTRGVSRWHFYGDPEVKELKADDGTIREDVRQGRYHPHSNILVEAGEIARDLIIRIRELWTQWLKDRYGWEPGIKKNGKERTAPVHYEYRTTAGEVWHLIEYITRPTFKELTDKNRHIARDLCRFHNTSWFGLFHEAKGKYHERNNLYSELNIGDTIWDDRPKGRALFEEWIQTIPAKAREDIGDVAAWDAFHTGRCPRCGADTEILGVEEIANFMVLKDYGMGLLLLQDVDRPGRAYIYDTS